MVVDRIARSLILAPLCAALALAGAPAKAEGPSPSAPAVHAIPTKAPVVAPRLHAPAPPRAAPEPAKLPRQIQVRAQRGGASSAHAAAASGAVQTPSLDVSLPRRQARQTLVSVRDEVARRAALGEQPIVVFDIDDTLLTWPRGETPRLVVPGALAYVQSLAKAGAKIVYITGRGADMRDETVAHLRDHGFPISGGEQLLLNDTELRTVEFKTQATRDLVRTQGVPVAAFDNEKENARMFRREIPDAGVTVVRLRTTSQRPDPGGEGPIAVIDDFTAALPAALHAHEPASSVAP
jgi:acid phosphatase class B